MSRKPMLRRLWAASLAAGLLCAGIAGLQLALHAAQDRRIAAVLAGHDAAIGASAPRVLQARAGWLIRTGHPDDAQAIADRLAGPERAAVLFALGNARLRQAMGLFGQVPFRVVRPLLGLARSDYRQVLQITPDDWAARYNYTLAAALLPSSETYQRSAGARMSHDRAVWPDIPGVPNGMP